MDLDIYNNISETKDKDKEVNQFIKELSTALNNSEMVYRSTIDEENFAPTLAKELRLSGEDTNILRNKIDSYLKEYSKHCGVITYNGYDMKKNQYYEDWYENGKRHRNKLTEQEFAQSYTMGWFYRWTPYPKDSREFNGSLFEEVKDAIKSSLQEQLAEGISIKDVNLLKLNNEIKNNKYLKPLYDEFNK